ncbi:MAG: UbiA family prenyltransferase [Planctomycetota bacterium]
MSGAPGPARWWQFVTWRHWGVLYLNPVFENTFVFFSAFLDGSARFGDVGVDLGLFVVLVMCMSSYGFLLNDAVDCERDLGHGDENVFAGLPPRKSALIVALSLLSNIPLLIWFRDVPYFLSTWIVWFVVTTAYSLPKPYLKGRGMTGLIAVMLAMRTLPTLLVLEVFDPVPDPGWLLLVVYVSLRGFTGDLAHQLHDYDEDRVDGIETYVVRKGEDASATLLDRSLEVERYALLVATGWMLWRAADGVGSTALLVAHGASMALLAGLVIFANRQIRRTPHIDPHRAVYPHKDVFYLLHKTFPKIVLSLYLALLLALRDPYWWLPLLVTAVYVRAFSWSRLRAALRLSPSPGNRRAD